MKQVNGPKRIICLGAFFLIATACSETPDPANEAPVDPEPGLYEITLSGVGILKAAGTEDPHSYCLRESDRRSFPHKLVQNYYKLHYSCTTDRMPREGNAIAGEIKCAADPKLAQGSNRFIYNGAVASDAVNVEVRIKFDATLKEGATEISEAQMKLAMKAMEHARFVIEAKRVGDCG